MTQGKDPTGARKGNNSSNGIGDLLRHPLLLVIIAGVFTLLGAILTARLSPEPKVLTTDGDRLSLEAATARIEELAKENGQASGEVSVLKEQVASLSSESLMKDKEIEQLRERLTRGGIEGPGLTVRTVTLSNGCMVSLEAVEKAGAVADITFKVHNPGSEVRMQFQFAEAFYNGSSHRSKEGNLGGTKAGYYRQIPSDLSLKGTIRFDVPASLTGLDLIRLHFLQDGRKMAEFRNIKF